ncbi:uncharacterized protein LOC111261684 isoform X2 [Varroa jacobsoni]|uniref:uncharacterized protein LOC111261684 isoform X2 n=1 Tax=Varroa jacobsoni TaxID=62625 RepID=UPI000BF2A4C9|nr:uncharacterized protein LOC111261684 isoform X2 [Varroa jacobsoni]
MTVFDDEPTMSFINCLIEKTDENVVEKTLSSIRELFPGSNLLQMMRYICKANNDEGHVIIHLISNKSRRFAAGENNSFKVKTHCHELRKDSPTFREFYMQMQSAHLASMVQRQVVYRFQPRFQEKQLRPKRNRDI